MDLQSSSYSREVDQYAPMVTWGQSGGQRAGGRVQWSAMMMAVRAVAWWCHMLPSKDTDR